MSNSIKKSIILSLTLLILTFFTGLQADASPVNFKVNGQEFNQQNTILKNGRTYIPIRQFTELLGAAVFWDGSKKEVTVIKEGVTVRFTIGETIVDRNAKSYRMDASAFINNSRSYAPVRFVAEALQYKVMWESKTSTVSIVEKSKYMVKEGDTLASISNLFGRSIDELKEWNQLTSDELLIGQKIFLDPFKLSAIDDIKAKAVIAYEDQELDWLARIIIAEAEDEPYEGQVAVGAVVVNRVLDSWFPNSIYDVIFQTSQFTPVKNGRFYNVVPDDTAYKAAYEALSGVDPVEGALYFYNPKISKSTFFLQKEVIRDIGNHRFLR